MCHKMCWGSIQAMKHKSCAWVWAQIQIHPLAMFYILNAQLNGLREYPYRKLKPVVLFSTDPHCVSYLQFEMS